METPDSNWLNNAINFDVHKVSKAPQILDLRDILYPEVQQQANIKQSPHRTKDALRLILLNLFLAWREGCPVRYSRNSRDYRHPNRYGKLYFKIKRVLAIIDSLKALGYIHDVRGYHFADGGKQSRMWASAKLIELFQLFAMTGPGIVAREQPEEIIQLRDENKNNIDYDDPEEIGEARHRLEKYNRYIQQQDISVELGPDDLVNVKSLQSLQAGVESGDVKLTDINLNSSSIDSILFRLSNSELSYKHYHTTTITNTIIDLGRKALVPLGYTDFSEYEHNLLVLKYGTNNCVRRTPNPDDKITLGDVGLSNIIGTIQYNYLHRVFSYRDFCPVYFSLGGRFYGAYHQRMSKVLRRYIRINGEPTVELDYSAHHIRILYHLENEDYRKDPYDEICSSDEERKKYKLATLAMINTESKRECSCAVRGIIAEEEGISYYEARSKPTIERFMNAHEPISHYLNSEFGHTLQNIDSEITDGILTRLTDEGVPCLPVHDSYICPAKYEGRLMQAMMEEYEKVLGYSPTVAKKH